MSLRRTIKRRIEFRDAALETHVEMGTALDNQTLTLAGNTFSSARRRMMQNPGKPARVATPVRKLPKGVNRTEHRAKFKAGRQELRSASAGKPVDMDALLFNTLPRAVRKVQLSLADYNAGVRV